MKKIFIKRVFAVLFIVIATAGCTKDMPKSLSEILKRNQVDGYETGGAGGGDIQPGGGGPSVYKGQNASLVHQLLSRVPGWKTASCANCNDGVPPVVQINNLCQRDLYVKAAVGLAWAAESYYRLGDMANASSAVNQMMQSLQAASALCGPSTINTGSCLTLDIFPCW